MKSWFRASHGATALLLVAAVSLVLTMALPATGLAMGVSPNAAHLQQNWSKQHSATPEPLANCAVPASAIGEDCYNTGTHLTWTLTLDVCTSSNTTCTGTSQQTIALAYAVALLPPGETYIPGSETSATLPTNVVPTFTSGLCSAAGAPLECSELSLSSDTYLLWTFSTVPSLNGHPQAVFTYTANLTAPDNTSLTDWAITHYTVSGLSENPPVTDSVYVANPILDILKTCPADVVNNSAISYGISLSNSGHENASGVTMTDPAPAGVTFTSASATSPLAGYTAAQGTWTGMIPAGGTVDVTLGADINTSAASVLNNASYTVAPSSTIFLHHYSACPTLVGHPAISVVKMVDPVLVSNQTANTISVEANVTNTGDTILYNVTAVDSLAGMLSCPSGTLAVGASMICTGSYVIPLGTSASYSNDTVVANGTDSHHEGVSASADASVRIVHPSISVVKTVDPTEVSNQTANTITVHANVTNTGDTTLYNVTASDSLAGALSCPSGTLAVGASMICTGTYAIPLGTSASYSNDTVVANGSDFAHNDVTAQDSASVLIVHPALDVVKSVSPTRVSNTVNNTIQIYANVTNTGDTTLTNVSVVDSIAGNLSCPLTTLTPGQTMLCTGTYIIPAGTNATSSTDTVTASGCDAFGGCVSDTSNATVEITHPSQGAVTDTNFCPLPNSTFRLIYNHYVGSMFQLKSSNPGQFYYNVFSTAGMAQNSTLTVTIPYPFVTTGANPIQVFLNQALPTCPSSPPSTNINSQFTISPTSIVLSSYSPQNLGSTVTVTLTLTGPSIAPGNQIWVAVHLSYGLKGQLFNVLSAGSASCPTPANSGPCAQLVSNNAVVIGNPQDYTFSNGLGGSSTVSSVNDINVHLAPSGGAPAAAAAGPALGLGLMASVAVGFVGAVLLRRKRQPGDGVVDTPTEG